VGAAERGLLLAAEQSHRPRRRGTVEMYMQLTDAEAAFRTHKSDLVLRPIWHHDRDRVQAHILICFLAFVLWKTLEQWMRASGLGSAPRTLLNEVRRLKSTDVILPTDQGRNSDCGASAVQTTRWRCSFTDSASLPPAGSNSPMASQ